MPERTIRRQRTLRAVVILTLVIVAASSCATRPSVRPPVVAQGPATMAQVCDAQTWPRLLPNVVGRLLYQAKDGALGCWDNIAGVAPDGHDPLHGPAQPAERAYRITAVSPASGTPVGRHDAVTVELAEVDATAPPAFRPCDWVSAAEAGRILGGQVSAEPYGDQTGSVDTACIYDKPNDVGDGVEVDLQMPGAFPVDASTEFAFETRRGRAVDGVGVKAACVNDLTTTPPSTTLLVLLEGDRLLRVIQGNGSCDTLKRFAQLAISRA